MKETVPDNTLKSLRSVLFRELTDLRNDEVDANHAVAVSKISSQIISSYAVEISAVKTANDLKERNLTYAANIANILTKDITTTLEKD